MASGSSNGDLSPAALAAQLGAGLPLEDRLVLAHYHGTRDGAREAFTATFAGEFRRFLEEYFDCISYHEAAAIAGCSERQIRYLIEQGDLPKDTGLGPQSPRTSLAALRALIASGRIEARKKPAKLRAMASAA